MASRRVLAVGGAVTWRRLRVAAAATPVPTARSAAAARLRLDSNSPSRARGASGAAATWPEHEYLARAHASLEVIYEAALAAGEAGALGDDFDAETDGGVVRLHLGEAGGYVVNTQTPTRQIWLSSPVSGPWRYDWDAASGSWCATRDGHRLFELLESELREIAGDGVEIVIREEDPV
jgi:frataxin